jgi:uncharacterized protein GlcG (DUF336 family)
MPSKSVLRVLVAGVLAGACVPVGAQPASTSLPLSAPKAIQAAPTAQPAATFTVTQISLEAAQIAAQAALNSCRAGGYQVAVAVLDRSGNTVVVLRDRFAGAHTVDTASNKAWTAASFKISTTALGIETLPAKPSSGIRNLPRVVTVGGGLPINASGSLVGAIGVSGAPGGDADEVCAKAGIAAIADDLAF